MKKKSTVGLDTMKNKILSQNSPFAYSEAFKLMRINLSFITNTIGGSRKILVTSSIPNEGKSVVSINLAITLAQAGARVLLIDCDLRKPRVHKYLRVKDTSLKGLTDVLCSTTEIADCIYYHPMYKFNFIVAGTVPPNPNEMLGSEKMKNLLDTLEDSFDYIICDTAPVGIVSDALVLSRFVDGCLFVVRQNYTKRNQVRQAKQSLVDVGAKILGAVLSRCEIKDIPHRYSYHKYGYDYTYGYADAKKEKQ